MSSRPTCAFSRQSRREDRDDQQRVADYFDDHLAEEFGQRRDVAVDALDQLAGRVRLVKWHIEAEQVAGQVGTEAVRGCPAQIEAGIGTAQVDHPAQQPDDQVEDARERQDGQRPTCLRSVEEHTNDLGVDQSQRDVGKDERGDKRDAPALGRKVRAEQPAVPGEGN